MRLIHDVIGDDGRLVDGEKFFVAHDDAAADDNGLHIASFKRIGELRVDVVHRDAIGFVQTDEDEVSFLADLERADLFFHVKSFRAFDGGHFQRTFVLAEGMQVLGAYLKNGLLSIDLARPEPEKIVKTIAINEHE